MEHLGTKEIQTNRLILRKFKHSDVNSAFNNWCNDDMVTKYLSWPSHSCVDVTESVLNEWIKSYENDDFYQWAVALKERDEPIGSISFVAINEKVNSVEVGYCIGAKWWNKGIMTETFSALLSFAFNEMKVNRVEARHDSNNPNSGKVMIKCGLKYEGVLRQSTCNNQGIIDAVYYSILASEYTSQ